MAMRAARHEDPSSRPRVSERSTTGTQTALGDTHQEGGIENRRGRDHLLLQRHPVPVTLAELPLHDVARQIESRQGGRFSDAQAQAMLVRLPDQLRTVDTLVGPLEVRVVGSSAISERSALQPLHIALAGEVGAVLEPLHDVLATLSSAG